MQLGFSSSLVVLGSAICGAALLAAEPGSSVNSSSAPALLEGNVAESPFSTWDEATDRAFHREQNRAEYSAEIHYDLGLYFYERGEYDLSLQHYRKAADIDPSFPEAYFGIGLLFYTLGDDENAIHYYRESLDHNPEDADTRNNLGLIHYRRGELELAREQIEEAIRIQPEFPDALYNLGLVHYQGNRLQDAVLQFREALTYDPGYLRARFNLGVVYYEMGELDLAREQWSRVMADAPDTDLAVQAQENILTLRSEEP